jgi:hypothetical protein
MSVHVGIDVHRRRSVVEDLLILTDALKEPIDALDR